MAIAKAILAGIKPKTVHAIISLGCDAYKLKYAEPQMAEIDAMPLEWRLLVHEHGGKIVRRYRERKSLTKVRKELFGELIADLDLTL